MYMSKFPLKKDKTPAVPRGSDWRDYAGNVTSDLFGLKIAGDIVVIDLDVYKNQSVMDEVETVSNCKLDWHQAELQITMNGGRHYAFRNDTGLDIINGSNLLGIEGFDTRVGGKGYIASGLGYESLTLLDSVENMVQNSKLLPPLPLNLAQLISTSNGDELDDLEIILNWQPDDNYSQDDMAYLVSKLDDSFAEDGSTWLKVGMALCHQSLGEEWGWELFDRFSKRCPEKYNERKNRKRWDSFKRKNTANPITVGSIIELAGGRALLSQKKFDELLTEATEVNNLSKYNAFKDKVNKLDDFVLPRSERDMLIHTLHENFGKGVGLTKPSVRKDFTHVKPKDGDVGHDSPMPDWLEDWVYVESSCEFANVDLNYRIKREAFNAKYNRELPTSVKEDGVYLASTFALDVVKIPCVVDAMFFPKAGEIFDFKGKTMLNTYKPTSLKPCKRLDDDGQAVVDMFKAHVALNLPDEREQHILINFLAYVVQNAGERVNWALVLQGAQGVGKSYFVNVMQYVLEHNASIIDGSIVNTNFNSWAEGSIFTGMEELRISGHNRYEAADKMKPVISNDTVMINEKGRKERVVPNFTSYLMLTNHMDAVPILDGDRRYCVLFSQIQSEDDLYQHLGGKKKAAGYFKRLFDDSARRADAIYRFLLDWQIDGWFNPKGRAPDTHAKKKMVDYSKSYDHTTMEELLDRFECEVINKKLVDVTYLKQLADFHNHDIPHGRIIGKVMLDLGYHKCDVDRVKVKGVYHRFWVKGMGFDEAKMKIQGFENYENNDVFE